MVGTEPLTGLILSIKVGGRPAMSFRLLTPPWALGIVDERRPPRGVDLLGWLT